MTRRRHRRFRGELFRSHLLVALLALVAVAALVGRAFVSFHQDQVREEVSRVAKLITHQWAASLAAGDAEAIQKKVAGVAAGLDARLTVIGPDGVVWADTWSDPLLMDNHGGRPEIAAARERGEGSARRYSDTLRQDLIYVGVGLPTDAGVVVVRAATPLDELGGHRRRLWLDVLGLCAVVTAGAALLGWWVSRRLARSLDRVRSGVSRFGAGDLDHRIAVPPQEEFVELVEGMNEMASTLKDRMRQLEDRREEEAIILRSLKEGLIAVDEEERVIKANRSASQLLNVDLAEAEGRPLQEVVRHASMQRFLERVLGGEDGIETEFTIRNGSERVLQAFGCVLRRGDGSAMGAVVVLHEVTRIRTLERIRSEFVANVSHELKTPITSIRGFVETLRDGAMEDSEQARRFLDILVRQSDRLQAIVDDLLTLSRLEERVDCRAFELERAPIRPVLEAALQFRSQTTEEDVSVTIECAESLEAPINPPLLEQAVMNLVDNAVKYGGEHNVVTVEARATDHELVIEVRDTGPGISREHLDRVFERFYRVDKGRSRERGGTGLGLSIVKHIAQAHGGRAEAESRPGDGATFRMVIPRSRPAEGGVE